MNSKHLIMASLILAILTIGAVSASENATADALTADDTSDNEINQIEEAESPLEIEENDFNASIRDFIDLEDESDQTAVTYDVPQGADGNVNIYVDEMDTPRYSKPTVAGEKVKITTENLNIVNPGEYHIKVDYLPASGDAMTLAQHTLNAHIYTERDFSIEYNLWINSKNKNIVSDFSYPVAGTLVLYVNGTPRCTREMMEPYKNANVYLSDLAITEDGIYNLSAKFIIAATSKEIDVENVTEIEVDDVDWTADEYVQVYSSADILDHRDYFIEIDNNGDYVNGTVSVYTDGTLKFNKSVPYSDKNIYFEIGIDDLGLYDNIKLGEHNVTVIYMKDHKEKHSVEKMVEFYAEPIFDPVHEISLGENGYFSVISTKNAAGTVTLYYAVGGSYDEKGSQYRSAKFVNGVASIPLDSLTLGDHNFILNITGYDSEHNIIIVVRKNSPGLSASVSASQIIAGKSVTVKFSGPKSNDEAYLTLDGRLWKSAPLTNGALSETISGLAIGTHIVNVFFDDGRNFYSNTFKVTVKKASAPAKKADKIMLTLKKVKVRKSAKKLVLKATLKINGKKVKGKVIKFKFNKKTYKAKTNKKGVAKVTIKKNVLKKLKVGKKVKYQAKYGKVTKKYKVKVKK
ncbi:hypothetical protein [Methanobrevibacter sp.]